MNYVPGKQAVLTVYYEHDNGFESIVKEQVPLHSPLRTKDELHQLLRDSGFRLKPVEERVAVLARAQEAQGEERFQKHKLHEYYRWREIYVQEFRERVVGAAANEAWKRRPKQSRLGPEKDLLAENYDRINKKEAAFKKERLQYAVAYLQLLLVHQ